MTTREITQEITAVETHQLMLVLVHPVGHRRLRLLGPLEASDLALGKKTIPVLPLPLAMLIRMYPRSVHTRVRKSYTRMKIFA